MPKASHHNAIARQWEILKRLPSRPPGKTAREITQSLNSDDFEASKRTVERDLVELSRRFPITNNNKGVPYGWHWARNAKLDIPGMTLADAMSLYIVEDLLRPLLPTTILSALEGRFRLARTNLDALPPTNRLVRWADKIRFVPPALSMIQPQVDAEVLETIQQALLEERQLDVTYGKLAGDEAHSLRLHPLGMVQRGSTTYLVATAFEYDDVRLYAVQRIASAAALDGVVKYPVGFSLDDHIADGLMQFGSRKEIRLRARVSDYLAGILEETHLSEDQKLTRKADSNTVQATVIDSWQLHLWIMSQGPGIEVLNPVRLRRDIEASLSEALAAYRSND